ncbi:ribokinase [Sediminicoccus sp. KRV36]|uniref:ribokinase n=1 Tax=Sediminicoccus sp. KRV36 TaxID=3133721 RepID=UPI00200E92AA|nr:ribokinase [Sediminicoccus rosea]UPY35144.1 ribokinase [Sediminicoccus rosea]
MTVTIFGSAIADIIFRVGQLPRPGETVLGEASAPLPGGKGLNQAIAAAQDGADARFVGCVGHDPAGAMLRAALIGARVNVAGLHEVAAPSGLACVCVDAAGQNQIAVALGANGLARADLVAEILHGATLLLQMEVPPEENARLIIRARAAGARVLLNLAPASAMDRGVLGAVDLLILNESEAAWLGQQLGRMGDALALHEALGIGIAVTKAERGAAVATHAGVIRQPAFPIQVVDSTGAGDAWCGVLAAALDLGMPMELAVRRANAAGALACTRPGAAPSMPDSVAIDALMGLD